MVYCFVTHTHLGPRPTRPHPQPISIKVITLLKLGKSARQVAQGCKMQRCVVQMWWRPYKQEGRGKSWQHSSLTSRTATPCTAA